jgi:hypothetical protein
VAAGELILEPTPAAAREPGLTLVNVYLLDARLGDVRLY